MLSIPEVISTFAVPLDTVVVEIKFNPPPASAKDNWPIPVVPEPDTDSTFKNLSAVTFPVGKVKVYDWPAECAGEAILTPWEFWEQFNCKVPSVVPSPLICNPAPDEVDTKFVFAFVTVESDGVPMSKVFPRTITKSMTSPVAKLDANVSVLPETVNESVGAWRIPLS